MDVVRLQLFAVAREQALPVEPLRDERRPIERRLRLLVRHLQEEQVGELLEVVPVRETVVAEDVAVVPESLDEPVPFALMLGPLPPPPCRLRSCRPLGCDPLEQAARRFVVRVLRDELAAEGASRGSSAAMRRALCSCRRTAFRSAPRPRADLDCFDDRLLLGDAVGMEIASP